MGSSNHIPKPCPSCGRERYVEKSSSSEVCVKCRSLWQLITQAFYIGDWVDDALCAQVDPEVWFPSHYGGTRKSADPATRICADCPVRRECWEYADRARIEYGVWGGEDEVTRRKRFAREGEEEPDGRAA